MLLSPLAAYCNYGTQLSGKWKEVNRWAPDNKPLTYKDTIHIEFLKGGTYIWQKQNSYLYRGTYKITDKDLDMGTKFFTIVSHTPDKLILKDETGQYEFAPDRSVAATNPIPSEPTPKPVSSINPMVGHWSKYKSTSATPLSQVDYTRQLKMIDITGGSSDGKLGYLYAAKDADNAPSWYIESFSDQTLYCNGKDKRTFKVIKCENNDLVLQEGDMTYFFRQFK